MLKNKLYIIFATGFGVGKIPFAPGTFGSLLAVLMWVLFNNLFIKFETLSGFYIFWSALILIFFVIGIYASEFYCKKIDKHDAGEIVIDEICGQLLTFLIASIFIDVIHNYFLIFLGFIFFRIFDIFKPFVIGAIDKQLKNGFGVMLDDLLAGFAAAVSLYAVSAFILS